MFFKNIISFDIGNKNIKIVLGRVKKNTVIVEKCITVEFERECIKDGEIINLRNLQETISETITSNNIEEKEVYCTINSSRIIQREIIVPKADNKELDTLIDFEVEQHIPIDVDNYIMQYKVLDELEDEKINKLKILVAMCPKDIAERYFKLFTILELKPLVLDVSFNSLEKIIRKSTMINDEIFIGDTTSVFIDIGADNTTLSILKCNGFRFARVIPIGGNQLNIQLWIDEVKKIIKYYKNSRGGSNIDRVYIYGGNSKIQGLKEYMIKSLNIEILNISSIDNIKFKRNEDSEEIYMYLNAIGALIRE